MEHRSGDGKALADRKTLRRFALGGGLLVAIAAFRGTSWFTPFVDPTIGLYQHIGLAWLRGHLPYTTTWDFRPPGYFALWAIAIKVVGAYFARDVLAVLSLWGTAWSLGYIAYKLAETQQETCGWAAAVLFTILSTANDAIVAPAEVQVSFFVAASVALLLRERTTLPWLILAGVIAGGALQCQLLALPLLLVPLSVLAMRARTSIGSFGAFGVGVVAPIIAELALYQWYHELRALFDANVGALLRRALFRENLPHEFDRNHVWLFKQTVELAPAIELGVFSLGSLSRQALVVIGGWLGCALIAIWLGGEFFERQFILLSAPASLFGAMGFAALMRRLPSGRALRIAITAILIIGGVLLHDYYEAAWGAKYFLHRVVEHDPQWDPDKFMVARAELTRLGVSRSSLFLIEQSPYLYDVLGVRSPTKFDYSDTLLEPQLSAAAGIDGGELRRIFAGAPGFVVLSSLDDYRDDPARVKFIANQLRKNYLLVFRDDDLRIYKRLTRA